MATTTNETLKSYRDYLESLYNNGSNDFFTNGGKEYATVLMSVLFSHANNSVKMFCEGLNPEIFNNEELKNIFFAYIDNGGKLEILAESEKYIDSDILSAISGKENVSIKIIQESDKKEIFKMLHTERCNFSIFDESMIRLETDPEHFKAIGSFNRRDRALMLTTLFDKAFNNAKVA